MTSIASAGQWSRAIRRFAAWHPEWWVLALSGGAWGWLLGPGRALGCACATVAPATWPKPQDWAQSLGGWFLMVLAMMLPLMIIPVRTTAFGSLWRRRHWAIGTFLASYVGVWMLAGLVSLFLLATLRTTHLATNRWVIAVGFLAAAGWQLTAVKRRFSAGCHWTRPLAPAGWPAHRDCLRFGLDHGRHCVGNCGILMFAAMLSPWHKTMMIVATLLLLYERYRARPQSRALPFSLGILAVGHGLG